jgi:hypothetical protein
MYRIFYAERDTTLYERYPKQNTGIDQILELTKIASGSKYFGVMQSKTYNSRILIDFGSEITTLSSSVATGQIPPIGTSANSASVYLNLQAANANDLLHSYTIEAYPISESWVNGNGNYSDSPIQKYGASWYYRDSDDIGTYWNTSSLGDGIGSTELKGGGSWHTGSRSSQTFTNESPDIRMDVTNIVNGWITSSITNNGFIIKRSDSDESSSEVLGSLKFFGRESHTIYVPKLEVVWNDTTFTNTGSSEISADIYVPYFKNIKSEYRRSEIAKFRIGVRPEFPNKAFQTSSFYLTGERLPTSSYYSIIDSVTDEVLIPFDTKGTQIDCDVNGSFMKLRMDSFMPERFYKIMLKIERDGANDIQTYDNFYFKVVK